MKKVCTYCGLERDAENDFNWEYKKLGKRQARCKYCQSELGKLHYQNNKDSYKATTLRTPIGQTDLRREKMQTRQETSQK